MSPSNNTLGHLGVTISCARLWHSHCESHCSRCATSGCIKALQVHQTTRWGPQDLPEGAAAALSNCCS